MAQEPQGQDKNENFFQKFWIPLLLAAIVAAIVIVAVVNQNKENKNGQDQNAQSNEQSSIQNNQNQEQNQSQSSNQQSNQSNQTSKQKMTQSNVTASGNLTTSDNPTRGNLMIESNKGKIYIKTARNFAQLLNKKVTLQAEGSLNKFVFLGFAESNSMVAGTSTTITGQVAFSGKLGPSDNSAKGNYTVTSGKTKVYLKTIQDYSSWTGSDVKLTATGTLNNFSNAKLAKK